MSNLSPPPIRDKYPVVKDKSGNNYAEFPYSWQKWFSSVQSLLSSASASGLILWASVSKVGSNLTDIATRNHADLQNINTASHTHLTATNHTDLTDGGNSTLHFHAADRDSANFTGTNWTDLTDGGETTLHTHAKMQSNEVLIWLS